METGSAAGQPAVAGDSITVTPAGGFKGVMVLRYTVTDKTGDVSRQTDGRVRITVRDKPDAPSAPAATDVRSRTAVLKWAPPSDNGATISKYTVRSNGFSQDCATTTCTLSGLTNDVKYVFTVTATNEVGESVPSPASNEIRPDEKPSPPESPTVKAGDKNMVITWPAAKTEGSAVKNYNLEISPPPASGIAVKNGVAGPELHLARTDQRRAVQGPRPGRQRTWPVRVGQPTRPRTTRPVFQPPLPPRRRRWPPPWGPPTSSR